MRVWNMGNTTARNPQRLREALALFTTKMSGRPFKKPEQIEFQVAMIEAGLVNSQRMTGDDGGRKFASAFKQLGFVTDWSKGQTWNITRVGQLLIDHPEIEETIFLRQLLKYQIASPLEKVGTQNFHLRPFRLLLRFLKHAHDTGLVGLTIPEIGLYVITILDEEDDATFQAAFSNIQKFRTEYEHLHGRVAKTAFAKSLLKDVTEKLTLQQNTLEDYADSNSRYAFMTGLLTLRGNKLAISDARLPFVETILADGSPLLPDNEYLQYFYAPELPSLPTDNLLFVKGETIKLKTQLIELATNLGEPVDLPAQPLWETLSDLQAYEIRLRDKLKQIREIQFYYAQRSTAALDEIEQLLEDIQDNTLIGKQLYAPAFFEWAIWRLFLAINSLVGPISSTRGFKVDEDINPVHHAQGGAADLTFTYETFKLVCEMTLATGSRQFAMEGEPVTRHVFKVMQQGDQKPVYGLFVANKLDPNTIDAFHKARYWKDFKTSIPTPIVALETKHVIALLQRMRTHQITAVDIQQLITMLLDIQVWHENGPSWYEAYTKLFEQWLYS